jgi:hypothetical protein
MAENNFDAPIGGNHEDLKRESSSRFNKDCAEFTPSFLKQVYTGSFQFDSEEDNLSTMGSTLEELLAQVGKIEQLSECVEYEETPIVSVSPSPPPSIEQSVSSLPPPPGYEPIDITQPLTHVDTEYYGSEAWRPYHPHIPYHLGYKLFVGALPYSVTEGDLYPLFSQFGEILELHIQRDWLGRSKGCAWLRYSGIDECDAAIEALHNNYYLGSMNRPMQLTYASDNSISSNRTRTHSFSTSQVLNTKPVVPSGCSSSTAGDSTGDRADIPSVQIGPGLDTRPRAMTDTPSTGGGLLSKLRMMSAGSASIPSDKDVESLFNQGF